MESMQTMFHDAFLAEVQFLCTDKRAPSRDGRCHCRLPLDVVAVKCTL